MMGNGFFFLWRQGGVVLGLRSSVAPQGCGAYLYFLTFPRGALAIPLASPGLFELSPPMQGAHFLHFTALLAAQSRSCTARISLRRSRNLTHAQA